MAPISGRACITIVWSGVSELGFRHPSTTWPRSLTTTTSAAVTVGYGMPLGEMAMRLVSGSRMLMLPAVPWTTPRANASNPTWTTCSRRCSSNISCPTPCLSRAPGSCELAADHPFRINDSQDCQLFIRRRQRYRSIGADLNLELGGVPESVRRHAGVYALDLQPWTATGEDAKRRDHPVDVSGRRDEIKALDEGPPIVLRPPEDDAARRRHQHRAARTARETHRWMFVRANGAEVGPPLGIDLDTAQERDVESAACGQIEEVGQSHECSGAM